jgi:Dullard-like phosphatase family protein
MQVQTSKPLKSFSLRRKSPFIDSLVSVSQSSVFPKQNIQKELLNNDPSSRSKNLVMIPKNSSNWMGHSKAGMDTAIKAIVSPRSSQLPKKHLKMNSEFMKNKTPNLYPQFQKNSENTPTFDRSIFGQSDPKTLLKETSSRGSKDLSSQAFLSVSKTVKGIRYKSSKQPTTSDNNGKQTAEENVVEIPSKEEYTPRIVGYKRPKLDLDQRVELPSRRLSPMNATDKGFYPRASESDSKQAQKQQIKPAITSKFVTEETPKSSHKKKQQFGTSATHDAAHSKLQKPISRKSDYFVQYLRRTFSQEERPADDYHKLAEEAFQYIVKNHAMLQVMKVQSITERPAPITIHRKYPNRKLLILDLDETLIHCSVNLREHKLFENQIVVKTDEGLLVPALLNIRPHVAQFLQTMSEHYELVLFTASAKYYASKMLRYIDPHRSFFSHVFYRESCCKTTNGKLVKDLTVFVNVPLKDMILVDNNTYCMWLQPTSGVPILNFYHDKSDEELLRIQPFLLELKDTLDHREVLKNTFKLPEMINSRSHEDYLRNFL